MSDSDSDFDEDEHCDLNEKEATPIAISSTLSTESAVFVDLWASDLDCAMKDQYSFKQGKLSAET